MIEIRYRPTLRVYAGMDQVGLKLAQEFPDWERSHLWLELRNKTEHRRLRISHQQTFFDRDAPVSIEEDLTIAREAIVAVNQELKIAEYARFGMRSYFTAETETGFQKLVEQVYGKLCIPIKQINAFAGMELSDAGYTVNLVENEWTYHVTAGPMEKSQWLSLVRHEPAIFEADHPTNSFERFRETLPERFLFVDVDVFRENVTVDDALKVLRARQEKSHEIANKLVLQCWS